MTEGEFISETSPYEKYLDLSQRVKVLREVVDIEMMVRGVTLEDSRLGPLLSEAELMVSQGEDCLNNADVFMEMYSRVRIAIDPKIEAI